MHPIHCINGKLLEKSFLHHHISAAAAFFGRLEDEMNRTPETRGFGQNRCGSKQHRRVPVMPAGMHFPFVLGTVAELVFFLKRQGIHIRS